MSDTITVHVAFDPDARVWFVQRSDVHGLRIEAATIEALIERIPGAIQDLQEDGDSENGHDVPVEVIARHSTSVRLDA